MGRVSGAEGPATPSQRPPWDLRPSRPLPGPPPPGRGLSNRAAVALGLSVGAALVVLVPLGLFVLVLLLRFVNVPPAPDGPPLVLAHSRLQGTWQDDDGGRLVLAADGTFSATDVCGDYTDAATGDSSGFGFPSTMSGTGIWESGTYASRDDATEVSTEFAPGRVSGRLEARGTPGSPLLWTYIGDPDDGDLCVLRKVGTEP
ncbi:hypothetical protein ACFVH0_21920 [Streptomyces sp. NPDC127117]|uniref:hypothetical protein n=1 Tax=Streptomyces sp. NPDC127117 TaxID=3345368 RepID=UPI0036370DD0